MKLQHAKGVLELDDSPVLMGILNVTPDSFSDGGLHDSPEAALERALAMAGEGAVIIDVGGESTRPGSQPVSESRECDRVLPVIERIHRERPDLLISIDTSKATVAREAIHAGAAMINDVSGGLWDPEMFPVVHHTRAAYICMHALDRPERMQHDPDYEDVSAEVFDFLTRQKSHLIDMGVDELRLAFDTGIGFGKTLEHNLELIRAGGADYFSGLDRPMLWGLSRKSFIDKKLGRAVGDRLPGGLAAYASLLRSRTPQIWRVHDVRETSDFLKMYHALS